MITGLTDGTAVSQWDDTSGNDRHVTQATPTSRPIYKTGILNGLPVLRFDGVDDCINGVHSLLNDQFTLFVVYVPRADEAIGGIVSQQNPSPTGDRLVLYSDTRTTTKRHSNYAAGSTSRLIDLTTKAEPNVGIVSTWIADASTVYGYINGALQGSLAKAGSTAGQTDFEIGRQLSGDLYFNGDVAEIRAYPTPFVTAKRQQI